MTSPTLRRWPIPRLNSRKVKRGPKSVKTRSYPVGKQDFVRVVKGHVLRLSLSFEQSPKTMQVRLNTDIHGHWEDLDFTRDSHGDYHLDIICTQPGLFKFKAQYSYNAGGTWFWDTVPHSYVMVEPGGMNQIKLYSYIPTVSGHIGQWKQDLHRIKAMGFNMLHLLPITSLDQSESPYSASDFFLIDPSYAIPGDPRDLHEQFEEFVFEAKKLGIGLCFDLVLNHVGIRSLMARECPDWIVTDSTEEDSLKRAGCWDNLNWVKWNDLALIKYDHPNNLVRNEIWHYMKEYVLFWANYAAFTGGMIRLDNLHSSNQAFLAFVLKRVHQEFPELIVFAELFTDMSSSERMICDYGLNLLLATPWSSPFAKETRDYIGFLHRIHGKVRYLIPVNSHDSQTPAREYGHVNATLPRYAAYALMGMGYTGLCQGVEFGAPEKIRFIGRQHRLAMTRDTWGHDFSEGIRKIHALIDRHDVFRVGGNLRFIDNNHGAVMASYRHDLTGTHPGFIILCNLDIFSAHAIRVTVPEAQGRHLRDAILEQDIGSGALEMEFHLAPSDFRVLELV